MQGSRSIPGLSPGCRVACQRKAAEALEEKKAKILALRETRCAALMKKAERLAM